MSAEPSRTDVQDPSATASSPEGPDQRTEVVTAQRAGDVGATHVYPSQPTARPHELTTAVAPEHTGETAEAPATGMPVAPGEAFGDYVLVQEIARGGMGIVYKAHQRSLQRIVALKMILGAHVATTQAVQRFETEARAAAALDHANIVPIFEIGEQAGKHYFTMAFVDGPSLSSYVKDRGVPPLPETVRLLEGITEAVEFAHRRGIIHRDLKPDNVLLDIHGRPRVTDFGLARRVEGSSGLTGTGQVLGTPSYMAPEQALCRDTQIGPPTDVYALGGILYFLLTGQAPFKGDSITETLFQVVERPPVSPRDWNASVPAELEAICLKCLAKAPADRYPSAAALGEALRGWLATAMASNPSLNGLSGTPASQPSGLGLQHTLLPGAVVSAAQPARRRRPVGMLVAVGLVAVLVVATALLLVQYGGGRAKAPSSGNPPEQPVAGNNPPPANVPAPAVAAAFPLNEPRRRDFDLKVEMVDSVAAERGLRQLREGQDVAFRIEVERDAYVGVWVIDQEGLVTQLFPNQFEEDHLIKASKPRTVPGVGDDFMIEATPARRPEQVLVLASTQPWPPMEGQRVGPYVVYRTAAERENWQRRTRGLKLKAKSGAGEGIAEEVLHFQVVPRKANAGR